MLANGCDTGIMDRGTILVEGPPRDLVREHIGNDVVEIWNPPGDVIDRLNAAGTSYERSRDRIFVFTNRGEQELSELTTAFEISHCLLRPASLEDVFLKLTGRELRE